MHARGALLGGRAVRFEGMLQQHAARLSVSTQAGGSSSRTCSELGEAPGGGVGAARAQHRQCVGPGGPVSGRGGSHGTLQAGSSARRRAAATSGSASSSSPSHRRGHAHSWQRDWAGGCAKSDQRAARRTWRGGATHTGGPAAGGAPATAAPRRPAKCRCERPQTAGALEGCRGQRTQRSASGASPRQTLAPSSAMPGGAGPPSQLYTRVLPRLAVTPARVSMEDVTTSSASRARDGVVTK